MMRKITRLLVVSLLLVGTAALVSAPDYARASGGGGGEP
jgi:hypothetical protein